MKTNDSVPVSVLETILIVLLTWGSALLVFVLLNNSTLVLPCAALVTIVVLYGERYPERWGKVSSFCFHYRWALAGLIFCLCVLLRLSGSSIGIFDEALPTQIVPRENTLFGIPREIRGDEYGVATLKYFSQSFNHYALYSTQMSLHPMNMVLDYYSPVWSWTSLGKPLLWGFLLFGNEVGLSWYWCGEEILLFMVSLEMCLILTRGQVRVSVLGAFLIAFAPGIQWWVMPHMPPVILFSMSVFCVGYYFFVSDTMLGKWSSALMAVIAVVGFALSIFPSFQVPLVYLMAALLMICLVRDKKQIHFGRLDVVRLALVVAAVLSILVPFLLSAREDLSLLMNTVYPGRRVSLGGGAGLGSLFTNLDTIFLPFLDSNYTNNCEASSYIHFAPFFIALSPRILFHLKKQRNPSFGIGITLLCALIVMMYYMVFGISGPVAELTLLRYCNRMHNAYDFVATVFTLWGLSVLMSYPKLLSRWQKWVYPVIYLACQFFATNRNVQEYFNQMIVRGKSIGVLVICLTLFFVGSLLVMALFQRKRMLSAALIALMLLCGATVNPIEQGAGALTNHPISAAVQEIVSQKPESRWLCIDLSPFWSNFIMANGAKVLSATNFYPDPEKWAILDPDGSYEEYTNRYSNQVAVLTEGESSVDLLLLDSIRFYLTPLQLKALEIEYLFSFGDPTELLERNGIACQQVMGQDGCGIYQLSY